MNKNVLRVGAITLGALLLASAGSAIAAAEEYGDEAVEVLVSVEPLALPGTLALSVAASSMTLSENGSTEAVRQFTGVLPNVTVTDTRSAEEIPDGANWYVLGTASDFNSIGGTITADHFGWVPQLVSGSDEGDGVVSTGGDVDTVLDGDRGLVDQELLYQTFDVPAVDGGGSWTANANLFLRVPGSVSPGQYSSVITLSLFE